MKTIVNGKLYDTATAKRVGLVQNYKTRQDLYFFVDYLYMKNTGEYFLYCEGGAYSKNCHTDEFGKRSYGEAIYPLSASEAKEWAEKNLEADEYIKLFGTVDE